MTQCVGTFDFSVRALLGDPRDPNDGAEGGLNANPKDDGNRHGGATNFGMTQPFYNEFCAKVLHVDPRPVRRATEAEARLAYYELIWTDRRFNCEGLSRLAPVSTFIYFDGAINHGHRMTTMLQGEVGATPDAWCGVVTLACVKRKVGVIGDDGLASRLLARRRGLYERHPDFGEFGNGWRARLNDLAQRADLVWRWHPPAR